MGKLGRKPYWELSDPENISEFDSGQIHFRYFPCNEKGNDGIAKLQALRVYYTKDGVRGLGRGITFCKDDMLKYPLALREVVTILNAWLREV